MTDDPQIDVIIDSTDAESVASIREHLAPMHPVQADTTREVLTILTITAAAVTLATNLVGLWKKLKAKPNPPAVSIEIQSGATLNLNAVRSAEDIERFVTAGEDTD